LVIRGDNAPLIKLGVPQMIEVVASLEMQFVGKIKDLPSPIRLNIQYMDKKSEKSRDLQVYVALGNDKKNKGKKYLGPKFIKIESKGVPNPI
jgi:hypothetical protein